MGSAPIRPAQIIEVQTPYGLLLIGPAWLKAAPYFQGDASRSGGSSQNKNRFVLISTLATDPAAVWRLRASWDQIDPLTSASQLSDHDLIEAVSDAIIQGRVAVRALANTPTAAFTVAQEQTQVAQRSESASSNDAGSDDDSTPVYTWSREKKVGYALRQVASPRRIGGELLKALQDFLSPSSIAISVGMFVALAVAQFAGVGEVADAALAILAWRAAGLAGLSALYDLVAATFDAMNATTRSELDAVADRYVGDFIILGTLFLAKLSSRLKSGKGGGEEKGESRATEPQTPARRPPEAEKPAEAGPPTAPAFDPGENTPSTGGRDSSNSPDFLVSPNGTVYPVPEGAQGLTPVINPNGSQTGLAYTGGNGGANGQVSTMRIMDPTAPRGASPGYPNGYIKYENANGQGVDPYSGRTTPNSASHYEIQ